MTDTRYLVHGVFWDGAPPGSPGSPPSGNCDGGTPVMRLQDPVGGFREVTPDGGSRLGFRVAAEGKSCLGHYRWLAE